MHPPRAHSIIRALIVAAAWLGGVASAAFGNNPASDATPAALHLMVAPGTVHADEVTLIWDKAPTGTSYQLTCDNQPLARTTKTHFTASGLQPGQLHLFALSAFDAAGATVAHGTVVAVETRPKEKVISVEQYGAKGDGMTLNTKAIQAAIDACPRHGIVLIPRGVFVSGALFLKSDMTLQIAAGGVLQGSTSPADYEPFIPNRFEGWELATYASLLNAGRLDHGGPCTLHNLSIRGAGKIVGGGKTLGDAMIAAHGLRSRGRLICLMNCASVEVQGLTLDDPPCWTLHYIYCEDVTVHDLTITSTVRNGDGLDPDSSRNSYIFNCQFSNGDDCIAIKSGKNPEGNAINRPTENVRIFDCRFARGHGISIGSEMSGGVRHVVVEDCTAGNLLHGLQIKATPERGGVVEDVLVRDCDLQKISILTKLDYNNDGAAASEPPFFRHFRFVNLDLRQADSSRPVIIVNGFSAPGHATRDVIFEDIKLPSGATVQVDETTDATFTNVRTAAGTPPRFEITRSQRIRR